MEDASRGTERLVALAGCGVLDTVREREFDDLLHLAARICGVPASLITLVEGSRQVFGTPIGSAAIGAVVDSEFCPIVVSKGVPVVIPDVQAASEYTTSPAITANEVRFYAGVPLLTSNGRALGTLCVIDAEPRTLGQEQIAALEALARQVVKLLELRSATQRGRAAEGRLRAIFESAVDFAIIATDPAGHITGWNAGARNITGWEEREVLGRRAHLFFTPEDCAAGVPEVEMAEARLAGRAVDERRHLRRDGSRFWADGHMAPLRDGGGELGFLKIMRDRTAVRAEQEANARLASIVAATSDAVIGIAAHDARVFAWNGGAEALFGYTEIEALGAPVDLLVPPELSDYDPIEAFHRVLAGERMHDHETVRMARDGTRIPVAATVARMLAPDGCPIGVSVIFRDLRVRRRAEAALRESQRRLKATHDNAGVGICEVDGAGRYIGINETFARMTGFVAAGLGTRSFLNDIEGEVDRQGASMALAAMLRGEVDTFNDRGVCTDRQGRRWWAEAKTTAIRDDGDGRFLYAVRVVQDVSERHAAEERQALLSREVDHRAKNALAVVQAALRLTRADNVPSYVRAVEGRVAALARAQTLLAEERWTGADLRALLTGELAPFLGSGGDREPRASLEGPTVELPPGAAQPLAMAVHELATNATKHGALSSTGGRVSVSWELVSGVARRLRLRWAEVGGPLVTGAPSRRGFGSRVLEGTLRDQLRGALSLAWEPSGLVCDLEVPLGPITEPTT